jgi:hypothetical protein
VAGVLSDQAKIYYQSSIQTRSIGRTSDLLAACLKSEGVDEYRLRSLLLILSFQVLAARTLKLSSREADSTVSMECGVDAGILAISSSFGLLGQMETDLVSGVLSLQTLDRTALKARSNGENFEFLLLQLLDLSQAVWIKMDLSQKRMEILVRTEVDAPGVCERVEVLDLAAPEPSPVVFEYLELGDLPYTQLLQEVQTFTTASATPEPARILSAYAVQDEASTRVEGVTEHQDDRITVQDRSNDVELGQRRLLSGSTSDEKSEDGLLRKQIQELQKKLERAQGELEKEKKARFSNARSEDSLVPPASAETEGVVTSLLKSMWPFKKSKIKDASPEFTSSSLSEITKEAPQIPSLEEKTLGEKIGSAELEKELELLRDAEAERRREESLLEIEKDLQTKKAKQLLDEMRVSLIQERAQIRELSRKLQANLRQNEHELRLKERQFEEDLKKRDELLKRRDAALERSKQQISQLSSQLDELRASASPLEDAGLKNRYQQAQQLLKTSKEEQIGLRRKVDELRNQLSQAESKARSHNESSALQMKLDRALKQAEDLKRVNQQLTERLNQSRSIQSEAGGGEWKKKFEAVQRQMSMTKKEVERLSQKLEDAKREEVRMKSELGKLQSENRRMKERDRAHGKPDAA